MGVDGAGEGVGGGVEGGGVDGDGVEGLEGVGASGNGVVSVDGVDVGGVTSGVVRESLVDMESSTCVVSGKLPGTWSSAPGDSATCQTMIPTTRRTNAAAAPITKLRGFVMTSVLVQLGTSNRLPPLLGILSRFHRVSDIAAYAFALWTSSLQTPGQRDLPGRYRRRDSKLHRLIEAVLRKDRRRRLSTKMERARQEEKPLD